MTGQTPFTQLPHEPLAQTNSGRAHLASDNRAQAARAARDPWPSRPYLQGSQRGGGVERHLAQTPSAPEDAIRHPERVCTVGV
jgi:hypothetical protein